MTAGQHALLAVALASAIPVAGTLLFAAGLRHAVDFIPRLVPFAVGAMIGAAVFHLLPDALARADGVNGVLLAAVAGAAVFAVVDRLAHRRSASLVNGQSRPTTRLTLTVASDALHNFIDGILIATTFLAQPALGVITAVAVALHEVPRELGTFALCVDAGMRVRSALLVTAATGVIAVLGALLVVSLGPAVTAIGLALVPFAAGNFLYLAGSIVAAERARLREGGMVATWILLIASGLLVTRMAAG